MLRAKIIERSPQFAAASTGGGSFLKKDTGAVEAQATVQGRHDLTSEIP
jgi:hypothetical protein